MWEIFRELNLKIGILLKLLVELDSYRPLGIIQFQENDESEFYKFFIIKGTVLYSIEAFIENNACFKSSWKETLDKNIVEKNAQTVLFRQYNEYITSRMELTCDNPFLLKLRYFSTANKAVKERKFAWNYDFFHKLNQLFFPDQIFFWKQDPNTGDYS